MKITVCIPAYNEALIIEETLNKIHAFCSTQSDHEWNIVVANNGSTDATEKNSLLVANTKVINVSTKGKGAAIVEAARQDKSDIFCFIDADLSASPDALKELIKAIEEGADIAVGSRLLDPSKIKRSFFRTLSSRFFNFCRKKLLRIKVSDSQCGLKAFNTNGRNVLINCTETGWFLDMEVLAKAEYSSLITKEVPIAWQEVTYPGRVSKLNLVRDGLKGLVAMIRINRSLSEENTKKSSPVKKLLAIAAFVYIVTFIFHTSAVNSTGTPRENLYYERGDSAGYVQMADSIIRNDVSLVADDEATRGLRTPGYPLFLAGVFTFSREPLIVIILQIIIALATIPLIYSLGERLTNSKISFWATLAYILYPTSAFLNTQILVETIYMFFTSLSIWLLVVVPSSWPWKYLAIGLTAGLAILIRPSFLYIIPLMILYLLIIERGIWKKFTTSSMVVIAILFVLAPWLNANYRDYDSLSLSTAGSFNILYVYIPQFLNQRNNAEEGWINTQHKFIEETEEAGFVIGSHRASEFESDRIKEELSGNEVEYAFFHLERSILMFITSGVKMFNNEMTELGRPLFSATPWLVQEIYSNGISLNLIKNNLLVFIDAIFSALITLLMPIGVMLTIWRRETRMWGLLLLLGTIMVTALLAGPNGNARYRMPVQPYIFLLAFLSLSIIFQSKLVQKITNGKISLLVNEFRTTQVIKGSKILFFIFYWKTKALSFLQQRSTILNSLIHKVVKFLPQPTFVIENNSGKFLVQPFDDSTTICSDYFEKELRNWLEVPTKKDVFIDIGANRGIYTIIAPTTFKYKKVHSFEPNPQVVNFLKTNVSLNDLENKITVRNTALGKRNETLLFDFDPMHLGGGRIVSAQTKNTIKVPVKIFDDFIPEISPETIDFIKIDTEGFEIDVLLGMITTLNKMDTGSCIMIESTDLNSVKNILNNFNFDLIESSNHDHLFQKNA